METRRLAPRWQAVLGSAGVAMVVAEAGIARDEASISPWLAGGMAAVAVAPVFLLRHRPRLALGLVAGLLGLFFAWRLPDGPIHLLPPMIAFAVATLVPARQLWPTLVAAVAALWTGQILRAVLHDQGWVETIWKAVAVSALIAAAVSAGWWVSSRREAGLERARRAATEEQLRMARDLHDGVGHGLAVIAMQAGVGLHVLDRDPAGARQALEAIREASKDALESLRGELQLLTGEDARAELRPRPGLADLPQLVGRVRGGGPQVDLVVDGPEPPGEVDHAAYAIVQEALTNVLRHADASAVTVRVHGGVGRTQVRVADNGRGGAARDSGGLGIAGMRARADALGGELRACPLPQRGFEVTAVLPWCAR